MIEFVVLDVETTGLDKETEICEVAFVRFVDGEVVDSLSSYVNPSRNAKWRKQAVALHGITKEAVKSAPALSQLKDSIEKFVQGKTLFAHNASFDVNRLMSEAGIQLSAFCTQLMSSELAAGKVQKLDDLCVLLGIEKSPTHDAEGDAIACGRLVQIILKKAGVTDQGEIKKRFAYASIRPTEVSHDRASQGPRNNQALRKGEFLEFMTREEFGSVANTHFSGKTVIFSDLKILSKVDAQTMISNFGGQSFDHVTKDIDYLVVGDLAVETTKLRRAKQFNAKKSNIQIISEAEFIEMAK